MLLRCLCYKVWQLTNMGDPWLVYLPPQSPPKKQRPTWETHGLLHSTTRAVQDGFHLVCWFCCVLGLLWLVGAFVFWVFGSSRIERCQSTSRMAPVPVMLNLRAEALTRNSEQRFACPHPLPKLSIWHSLPLPACPEWNKLRFHRMAKSIGSAPADHWPRQCNAPIASTQLHSG